MENVNKRGRIFFSLSKLECSPQEINSREICLVDIRYFQRIRIDTTKSEEKLIHFQSDVFISLPSPSLMLKLLIDYRAEVTFLCVN